MREIYRSGNLVEHAKPIVDKWTKCDVELNRTTVTVQACLRNLSTYVNAISLRTTKRYLSGYRISDVSYHHKADLMTEVPAELQAPALLDNVTQFGGLARAKDYLMRLNGSKAEDQRLIFFSYKSQHLGTPDNDKAFGRLLVVVPGNPEKWVQYGVPEFPRQAVKNVSVVAVDKRADGTRNVYFKDRALIRNPDGRLVPKGRFELGVGADACMDCHKGGVNPIFPAPGSVSAEELPLVDQVNQRFYGYLPPGFDGDYDPGWFGPGLGTSRQNASVGVLQQRIRQGAGRQRN
jgi:hypothetical protein